MWSGEAGSSGRPGEGRSGMVSASATPARVAWLPIQELALDLQADEQKEQGHERVIDPMQEAEPPDLGVEHAEVGRGDRRVRHRGGGAPPRNQDEAAARLALQEEPEGRSRPTARD